MKKLFAILLLVLAVIWFLMVLFKVYLAVIGYVDFNGRGPADHLSSAFFQALLAVGSFMLGRNLIKNGTSDN
jgi:hypothetical protein